MADIGRLFIADLKGMLSNVAGIVITIGLIILPSIFAWFNILACWNVFGTTDKIAVAIANSDTGFESDLFPVRVNIGAEVLSELDFDGSVEWKVMGEKAAIDAAESGECYAAIVIPPDFSKDMLSFYLDGGKHADILYYANEKKNPISPKITNLGASDVSYDVNRVFAQTLAEVAAGLAQSISGFADRSGMDGRIEDIAGTLVSVSDDMRSASGVLGMYGGLIGDSSAIIDDAMSLASDVRSSIAEAAGDAAGSISELVEDTSSLGSAADSFEEALGLMASSVGEASEAIEGILGNMSIAESGAAEALRELSGDLSAIADDASSAAARIGGLEGQLPEEYQPAAEDLAQALESASISLEEASQRLGSAAESLDAGSEEIDSIKESVVASLDAVEAELESLQEEFASTLKPGLAEAQQRALEISATLQGIADSLGVDAGADGSVSGVSGDENSVGIGGTLSSALSDATDSIDRMTSSLDAAAERLGSLGSELRKALALGDNETVRRLLDSDASSLAVALSSPVGIDRHAVFESGSFGSSMTPFYSTMGMYIGSLLLVISVRPNALARSQKVMRKPTNARMFLGRFGVIGAISLCQTTLLGLGDIFILRVVVGNPILLMCTVWLAGLTFAFLIYSLVSTFASLGKSLAVILLVIQITGCTGTYPLEILPWFVSDVSPWLPATHSVDAMRAAMFGIYENDYLVQMGKLALFIVPALVLGLFVKKPFSRFTDAFMSKVESTGLIA